jgi:hypothetical protein
MKLCRKVLAVVLILRAPKVITLERADAKHAIECGKISYPIQNSPNFSICMKLEVQNALFTLQTAHRKLPTANFPLPNHRKQLRITNNRDIQFLCFL